MIAVITTIAEPTESVYRLVDKLKEIGSELIVVGDTKGPLEYECENTIFFPMDRQYELPFELVEGLPTKHYARKNLGYLVAIERKSPCIYETDDDNAPLDNWEPRTKRAVANMVVKASENESTDTVKWINVYRCFSRDNIWPRGLPLDMINSAPLEIERCNKVFESPIQQGLVNNSPDVDAIWRLVKDRPFEFEGTGSVWLAPGQWCPFNTQSTWWWPEAYPLLYIPSFCSFRMCDIWKSFVAQRCLWEMDYGVIFHAPEVYQDRNPHNLMKDFEDEIPGYMGNHRFASVLQKLSLRPGAGNVQANMIRCYEELIKEGFFPEKEMELIRAWGRDIENFM